MTEEILIEKMKQQTEELWNTIQEAKKSNLKVQVGFDDYLVKPQLHISKDLFIQDGYDSVVNQLSC
ncbi:hypothetical protein [Yeosuana sp.]|uniref:hypothetical protein n=1 Tax=Yeosuana sp. TaxID=2529388 RepID=UPI0040496A9C